MLHWTRLVLIRGSREITVSPMRFSPQMVAVLGPSGSGKTSFFHALSGLLPFHEGHVFLDDRELTGLPGGARPVSLMFQNLDLFEHLRVIDNVALGLGPRHLRRHRKQALSVLSQMALAEKAMAFPGELSGGEQRRVALARVLLRASLCPIVLLDEPFASVDPRRRQELVLWLQAQQRTLGLYIFIATHLQKEADQWAQRVLLFRDGGLHESLHATSRHDDGQGDGQGDGRRAGPNQT